MEDKQQTPENTNRFQSSREDSSSPTRCAPRVPHSGLFPLHGAVHKKESCLQDSPPAAGRESDMLPSAAVR